MEVNIASARRDQVNAPRLLYKYRAWDNDYHRTIVTDRTVFMAAPSSFEDEKEFRNFKRYDLMTQKQIHDKYLEMSKSHNPHWSRQQRRAHAIKMAKNPPFKDPKYLKEQQENHYQEYDKRIGVLSLTAINDSQQMWNYYSKNGTGFCLGFDSTILFDYMGGGGEVVYPPDGLPIIYGTDDYVVERWKQTYHKEVKWSWEREYRVLKFETNGLTPELRKVKLPPACYRRIIFGWAMSQHDIEAIKNACKSADIAVDYFQASFNDGAVNLEALI